VKKARSFLVNGRGEMNEAERGDASCYHKSNGTIPLRIDKQAVREESRR